MMCSNQAYSCCGLIPEGETESPPVTETTTLLTINPTPDKNSFNTNETDEVRHISYQIDKGCGIERTDITTRILTDGIAIENTVPGEVPWIVAIFQKNRRSNTYRFKCAGTLIHPRVVLTATHCVLS